MDSSVFRFLAERDIFFEEFDCYSCTIMHDYQLKVMMYTLNMDYIARTSFYQN